MKRLLLVSFCAVAALFCLGYTTACSVVHSSGKLVSEKRELSGFTAIDAGGALEIEVTQSDAYSVEVETEKENLPTVITTVENGTLKISMDNHDLFDNATVHVKVSLPKLSSFGIHGASQGIAKNITTDKLHLDVSGASKLIMKGTATELYSDVSGASKLDAKELIADNATVECAGASKAHVHANTSLNITAEGASKVIYSGTPKVTKETRGASSIAQE